jgi:hypothetical protein
VSELLKFLFEQVTDPLTLPIHPLLEWLVLWCINRLVYKCAYKIVGNLYSAGYLDGSEVGKLAHWFLRTICFFIVLGTVRTLIVIVQFILNHWIAVTIGAVLVSMAVIIGYVVIKHKRNAVMKEFM